MVQKDVGAENPVTNNLIGNLWLNMEEVILLYCHTILSKKATFINNLISYVNIWVRKITILCLLPKPSYELSNCLSLLLSHIREYMPLIQFVKLGDKIRVQST